MHKPTFYWHDYETFGADPARDRPAQFAGLRTDHDFNIIGEPCVIYCKPSHDKLPQPEACLITGITPQLANEKGVIEAEFIRTIHKELSQANTCVVGYNNIRFDDEVTRYTLYRNFYDPYAREWQNGNSRWDIIDMARLCYALRPEGIQWPQHEDGKPSFRLEDLSNANDISHQQAHDALSDVYATIGLAKLIRQHQPKLYEYLFNLRKKNAVAELLNKEAILVHASSKFPSEYACTSLVAPLITHPINKNGIIAYDLRYSPEVLLDLSADEIRHRLFTKTDELAEHEERVHLKTIHLNKCPALAPRNTITEDATQRMQLDVQIIEKNALWLQKYSKDLSAKIALVFEESNYEKPTDPEHNLYGGFFSDADRNRITEIRKASIDELCNLSFAFDDQRLPELFFRYKARNWPNTLTETEKKDWEEYRYESIHKAGGSITYSEYQEKLTSLAAKELTESQQKIVQALVEYGKKISLSGMLQP